MLSKLTERHKRSYAPDGAEDENENDERYQLDVTILFIIVNNSTCFGHLYVHLQDYIGCIRIMLVLMVFSTRCCG